MRHYKSFIMGRRFLEVYKIPIGTYKYNGKKRPMAITNDLRLKFVACENESQYKFL